MKEEAPIETPFTSAPTREDAPFETLSENHAEHPQISDQLSEEALDNAPETLQSREANLETPTMVAEGIAVLLVNLEDKILSDKVPEDQWTTVAKTFIEENPDLQDHEGLILTYIKRRALVKEKIEHVWNAATLKVENEKDTKEVAIALGNEMGLDLKEATSARAVKHSQAYVFYVDNETFLNFYKRHSQEDGMDDIDPESIRSLNNVHSYGVPVIVLREGDDKNMLYARREMQNLKNHTFISYAFALDGAVKLNPEVRSFVQEKLNDDSIETAFEGKILALFSIWINTPLDHENREKQFETFGEDVAHELCGTDLISCFEHASKIGEEPVRDPGYYQELIEDAVYSLVNLALTYAPIYKEKAVEVAIGVLQQYKMLKWRDVLEDIHQNINEK